MLAGSSLNQTSALGNMGSQIGGPKELGVIQRADGIRDGIEAAVSRLEALEARMAGVPGGAGDKTQEMPAGLFGALDASEGAIRRLHAVVDRINGRI